MPPTACVVADVREFGHMVGLGLIGGLSAVVVADLGVHACAV
ncbi:MAG: hypothetical protein JWP07_1468, partial [Pseudonocardiales bacterium]|jgi:hypothetical protein|nr:hypothetical protein [Pseudonocardiales bacterium]